MTGRFQRIGKRRLSIQLRMRSLGIDGGHGARGFLDRTDEY